MTEQLEDIPGLIQKAYDTLKASGADAALFILDEAISKYYDNTEALHAQMGVEWWIRRMDKVEELQSAYAKGDYILSQWKPFYSYIDKIKGISERCLFAIRRCVYNLALHYFEDILGDKVNQHDPALLLQVGRCYKGAGVYDSALFYLQQAVKFRREDGETLSELADVNALLGDPKAAKALFREAFFMDPQGVNLRAMESDMITVLRDRVLELGIEREAVAEWIPIYGRLFGVFTIIRELKASELGKLKQAIFSLENEIRGKTGDLSLKIPRLINRYFWLIDHYENVRGDPALIGETLLKIKIVDPEIYKKFIR